MSNVLAIPLITASVDVANNEDWVDSIKYLVSDGADTPDLTALDQLDLRGISFEMEVRRKPEDHEVILIASTENHWLGVGAFPDFGYLLFQIPLAEMKSKMAGSYVADVVASDGQWTRKIIEMELTIIEGITR